VTINFGSIKKYNTERGFGFVSQSIHNINRPTRQAFFHITTVNSRYPDLAQQIQLENASYQDISFWYEVETTKKGESVSKLWLSANDIPPSQDLDILTEQIEGIWIDIDTSTPHWLNQVTLDLVGQTRMDELNEEREKLQGKADDKKREKKEADDAHRQMMIDESRRQSEREHAKYQARLSWLKHHRPSQEVSSRQNYTSLISDPSLQALTFRSPSFISQEASQSRMQNRASEIQKICENYKIEQLVHFTHICNLHSILQNRPPAKVSGDRLF
jgi:cold shock CspA family protein